MQEERTTAVVQRYLDQLAGDTPSQQAVPDQLQAEPTGPLFGAPRNLAKPFKPAP